MLRIVALVLALLTISAPTASAVGFHVAGVSEGTKFLFNNFQFVGESRLDTETYVGTVFGVSTEWSLRRRSPWHLLLGVDYVQKGYKGKRQLLTDPEEIEVSRKADYISIPLLGRVLFSNDDDLIIYAVFGPGLEFLLDNDEDDLLDDFKSWSISGNVGMGFEMPFRDRLRVQIEARFSTDFTDNWDGPDAVGLDSARYQMVVLTGGLRF